MKTKNNKTVEETPVKKIVPTKLSEEESKNLTPAQPSNAKPVLLNQKRTKMIADQENAESDKKESQIEVGGEERKIIKARRKFRDSELDGEPGKEESTREDVDLAPRGKFALKASFGGPTTEQEAKPAKPTFNFGDSLKAAAKGEEVKASTNIYDKLGNQVKIFANKNLFANPMVKQLPPVKALDKEEKSLFSKGPIMKTEKDEKRKSFVQANPLNSSDALRIKKSMSRCSESGEWGAGSDSPVLKSLFDVKGNSKFKNRSFKFDSKGKRINESSSSDEDSSSSSESSDEEEDKVKTGKGPFSNAVNPFQKKNNFNFTFKPAAN